jgi:gluconokinase
MTRRLLVMGVSGSGKSTIAAALAKAIGGTFIDADHLHPAENVAHMSSGHPLTDAMRRPWLEACGAALGGAPGDAVLACSALKRSYRDQLRQVVPDLILVSLEAPRDLVAARMAARIGHFMPAALLDSQYAALEPPNDDEAPIRVGIDASVDQIVQDIGAQLRPSGTGP